MIRTLQRPDTCCVVLLTTTLFLMSCGDSGGEATPPTEDSSWQVSEFTRPVPEETFEGRWHVARTVLTGIYYVFHPDGTLEKQITGDVGYMYAGCSDLQDCKWGEGIPCAPAYFWSALPSEEEDTRAMSVGFECADDKDRVGKVVWKKLFGVWRFWEVKIEGLHIIGFDGARDFHSLMDCSDPEVFCE